MSHDPRQVLGGREQNYERLRELGEREAMWTEKNSDIQLTDAVSPWHPIGRKLGG